VAPLKGEIEKIHKKTGIIGVFQYYHDMNAGPLRFMKKGELARKLVSDSVERNGTDNSN
jgi:hypothetical protein